MSALPYPQWLESAAKARLAAGTQRALRVREPSQRTVDLASNDYLNLASDPRVIEAASAALKEWGAGSTGSRLVTGSTEIHRSLEAALARTFNGQAALVFSSGYLANLGAISALADSATTVISDALNHASLIDAIRLARARTVVAPHGDLTAVAAALRNRQTDRALVVTDAVFSVDGDIAPLADLHALCVSHDALLIVDEAHSLGVIGDTGAGASQAAGIAGSDRLVITATASKSLGSQGGVVVASAAVIDHVLNTARAFIFDTALAPASAGAALAALDIIAGEPDRVARCRDHAQQLRAIGIECGYRSAETHSAVTSLQMPDAETAVRLADYCRTRGVWVGCFRPPSVPDGVSRLRLTAHSELTDSELELFADTLGAAS